MAQEKYLKVHSLKTTYLCREIPTHDTYRHLGTWLLTHVCINNINEWGLFLMYLVRWRWDSLLDYTPFSRILTNS